MTHQINIDIESIGNCIATEWACGHFDSIMQQINGIQNILIYSHNEEAYEDLKDDLFMLWEVALERRVQ